MARVIVKDHTFYCDFLAYREVEDKRKKEKVNQLVSFSLMGSEYKLERVVKQKGRVLLDLIVDKMNYETFQLSDIKNFDVEKQKGSGMHKRYIFTRKVERMLKKVDEAKEKKSFPIVAIHPTHRHLLQERVYKYVKSQVTFGMMSVVTEPLLMARELMVDIETAKKVLDVTQGTASHPDLAQPIIQRGRNLLSWYKEWETYIYHEMKQANLIRPISIRITQTPVEMYEVVVDESKLKDIISKGLRYGHIRFSDAKRDGRIIRSFDEFMPAFAPAFREVIANISKPKHKKGDFRTTTLERFDLLKRKPLEGQKNPMEAALKSLSEKGKVNFVGECGVGKSFQMMAVAYMDSLDRPKAMKALIYCPDTLVHTVWEEEIQKTLYDCDVHIIKSIGDLIQFEENGYFDDGQDRAFVLSQGAAKASYTLQPAIHWSKSHQHFSCPDCGKVVKKKVLNQNYKPDGDEPKYLQVPVEFNHFRTLRYNNYACKSCKTILWMPNNKHASSYKAFVSGDDSHVRTLPTLYINGDQKGYYPRDVEPVKRHLRMLVAQFNDEVDAKEKNKLKRLIEDFRHLELTIRGTEPEGRKIQPHQVSIAQYIFKKMNRRFTHLICDEFHEYQGDSSRADACSKLIASVPRIITGTGTAMNGYAKSRFNTDFMLYPEKLKQAGFTVKDQEKYQLAFGVTEKRYRLIEKDGKPKKEHLSPRARPGISPIIFPLFMQDTTVFVTLEDVQDDLPDVNHHPIEVDVAPELNAAKVQLEATIRDKAKYDMKLFRSTLPILYSFLDMPTVERELSDKNGEVIVSTPKIGGYADHKLQKLRDIVRNEVITENRRMILYTYYTNDGINHYLKNKLMEDGYRITVLNKQEELSVSCDGTLSKVKKEDRERYIRNEVAKGTDILIVNPELVATGYNLVAFSTIVYYQMSHQLYTNRQADSRISRIGQTRDCKIIYLYYKDSMQADIASLMATKIVASRAIEGNMDAGGLRAITQSRTAEEELADKFFEGMKR